MIGYDSIGQAAIGELTGDQLDVIIYAPAPFEVTVTKAAPLVAAGKSVAPAAAAVAVIKSAPAVRSGALIAAPAPVIVTVVAVESRIEISATVTVPSGAVTAALASPLVRAGAIIPVPAAAAVNVTRSAPFVTAGKSQFPTAAPVAVLPITPGISISANIFPAAQPVTVEMPAPQILGGNYIEASNTITMQTPYGEIGSSSIAEFSIGEGEPSSRIVKRSPLVIVSFAAPFITAGKSQRPPTAAVSVSAMRPEIANRSRKLRILAIAS